MINEELDRKLKELNAKLDASAEKVKTDMRESFGREVDRVMRFPTLLICVIGGALIGNFIYTAITTYFGGR